MSKFGGQLAPSYFSQYWHASGRSMPVWHARDPAGPVCRVQRRLETEQQAAASDAGAMP